MSLRNSNFKIELVRFLTEYWQDSQFTNIIDKKCIVMNSEDKCHSFKTWNGSVVRTEELSLYNTHEEADSRMIYHLASILGPANVVIRANDTDVLIILLSYMPYIATNIHVWQEVGFALKNTLRFIDVNKAFENLGANVCKALPAFHAFTGSDYTAKFTRKAKVKPFHIFFERSRCHQTIRRSW